VSGRGSAAWTVLPSLSQYGEVLTFSRTLAGSFYKLDTNANSEGEEMVRRSTSEIGQSISPHLH